MKDFINNKEGDNKPFFQYVYDHNEKAPWDIGHPQQSIVDYVCRNDIRSGRCLEIGCGTGDLSIYLAERGCSVLGIDFVAGPIGIATQKISGRNLPVKFAVRDAFHLEDYRESFDFVFDVGFLHNLTDEYIVLLEKSLSTILKSRGKYILLGFAVGWEHPGPRAVDRNLLERYFAAAWSIDELLKAVFEQEMNGKEFVPALLAVLTKDGGKIKASENRE